MRGLLKAGLLLAPALARGVGAAASQENTPSAFISLNVPEARLDDEAPFLSFRLDVLESPNACGPANVTLNGEALPETGQLSLPLVPNYGSPNDVSVSKKDAASAVVSWETDCVSWGGQDREQVMHLRVVSVNGVDVKAEVASENAVTIRFRQTAPARVVLVEGAASVFHFNDGYYPSTAPTAPTTPVHKTTDSTKGDSNDNVNDNDDDNEDNTDSADFLDWENSLTMLHHRIALFRHDIHMREQYISNRFGPSALHQHSGPCPDVKSLVSSVFHKVAGKAKTLYGNLVANAFGEDGPQSRPGRHGSPHGYPNRPPHATSDSPPSHWPMPHCFHGVGHSGPPPLPPPPPSFLFHCSSVFSPVPPAKALAGPPLPPPPQTPSNHDSPPSPGDGPREGHRGRPSAIHSPVEKAGDFRGRKMQGHGHSSHTPPGEWSRGRHGFGGPRSTHFPRLGRAPVVKMIAFFALILVLLFVFVRHLRNRRIRDHLRNRRSDQPRGFRGFAARFQAFTEECRERRERRQARRERRRQRRESVRNFFRSVRRLLFSGDDDDEKLAEAGGVTPGRTGPRPAANGHIEASMPPSRQRTPIPSLEDDIAQFRAAVDVVGQMIAAEEGRVAVAQTAEARRRQEEDQEQAARTRASATTRPPPAPTASYYQPPPPPPPPPSMANSSSVYGGYGQRDAGDIDSDFDDVESLPPAYSSDDYDTVNLVEASVIADGFQYRPSSNQ